MFGWHGRILKINLDLQSVQVDNPAPEVYRDFVGGRGLAGFYLRDRISLEWNDPAMPVLLFTGPLVDTAAPMSGRMAIMSRSPLTGTIGDCSVGGALGTLLKRAGWDGVIITGKSEDLCGIEINDDHIAIVDAVSLRGWTTGRVSDHLKEKGSTAVIGPAAENGVLFSNILVDGHFAAGRNGIGLSLAAKNIKYITVNGSGRTRVYDPAGLKRAREDINRLIAASPVLSGEYSIASFGTGALYDLTDSRRMMPTRNFRATHFPGARALNARAYQKTYEPRKAGCRGCSIHCKKIDRDGRPLPEFETMSHFSALLENRDIEMVMQANQRCNDLGIDTISTAATLACYGEIENKTLSPGEIIALIEDIGKGRGKGIGLGKGAVLYAASRARKDTAMAVKGQELPAYDPRGAYGMALAYAVSSRGGCHLRAYPVSHEILRKPVATDRFSFSGKARIIKTAEDLNAVADSLTACKFVFLAATLEEYAAALTAVTGVEMSAQQLLSAGERICYQERIMNSLNGFTQADDDLPGRFFTEAGSSGDHIEVPPLDREAFLGARARYYRVRGLDAMGKPLEAKARELGLRWNA